MRSNLPSFIAAVLLFASGLTPQADEPIRLHPDNPHYFLWRGQPTVLITASEHYGAVMNLDFDYARYLDELKTNRFNLTRVFSGVYREVASSFNITGNTLAPAPGRYVCPWARSQTSGASDGGNKFDLTQWDTAYFDRLMLSSTTLNGPQPPSGPAVLSGDLASVQFVVRTSGSDRYAGSSIKLVSRSVSPSRMKYSSVTARSLCGGPLRW